MLRRRAGGPAEEPISALVATAPRPRPSSNVDGERPIDVLRRTVERAVGACRLAGDGRARSARRASSASLSRSSLGNLRLVEVNDVSLRMHKAPSVTPPYHGSAITRSLLRPSACVNSAFRTPGEGRRRNLPRTRLFEPSSSASSSNRAGPTLRADLLSAETAVRRYDGSTLPSGAVPAPDQRARFLGYTLL